jgi:plastocyanin
MLRAAILAFIVASCGLLAAQDAMVRGTVKVVHHSKTPAGNADVVVWLTNTHQNVTVNPGPAARLAQKNKQFTPHVIAITVGTAIQFPNLDPFFHDVFSIYHGKPFDLGLYEAGTARTVRFSQPGVSYIFCNIHTEMSAAVVALSTPYFSTSTFDGNFQIGHVPPGHYKMEVWYELASEAELTRLSREIDVLAGNNDLPAFTLNASEPAHSHVNKYGESYPTEKIPAY